MFFDSYCRYSDDPMLRHQMTFEELEEKIGREKIFEKTNVDAETQEKLSLFFALDRLCDNEKRFLWLWRRNLLQWYPVYLDEMTVWAERKTMAWFFDNYKTEHKEHSGNINLDETTKTELKRTLARVFEGLLNGTEGQVSSSKSQTDTSGTSDNSHTGSDTKDSTGKDRQFSFNYPESNYQGGVIPYDIDNNPSVEFLNSQGDRLTKSHDAGSDSSTDNGETSGSEANEQSGKLDTTRQQTDNQTTNDTENQTGTGEKKALTEETWTEDSRRQGDNINKLLDELLATIGNTDFFRKFTKRLQPCFRTSVLVDEIYEEDGYEI